MELENGRIILETGDITQLHVDAIVNAANSSLMGGGGVDGAIHRAGGPEILRECRIIRQRQFPQGLPTGEAVATGAGNMKARYIIHTVGPIFKKEDSRMDELLANAYINSLSIARDLGLQTIAFPAISTGVYGFPKDRAAPIVFKSLRHFFSLYQRPQKARLLFFKQSDMDIFLESIKGMIDES
ncbi:MAG: O-acetyl-ADP-ribose deacetylase [Spirochaetales bacterium]|nr:O-acetyl-ADP-ribose deacetylase [Spirochaetales bacterium]